jgi:hypothetical protein
MILPWQIMIYSNAKQRFWTNVLQWYNIKDYTQIFILC